MGRHAAVTTDRTIVSWLTPDRRRWLYGVACAALALAGAYGLLDDQMTSLWNILAAAVLGVAVGHTGGTYTAPVETPVAEVPVTSSAGTGEATSGDS